MENIQDDLAIDVKSFMVETCAKVAEIHLRSESCVGDRFYNKAVRDIAMKIRQLNTRREA